MLIILTSFQWSNLKKSSKNKKSIKRKPHTNNFKEELNASSIFNFFIQTILKKELKIHCTSQDYSNLNNRSKIVDNVHPHFSFSYGFSAISCTTELVKTRMPMF